MTARRAKYNAVRTRGFASKREYARYQDLKLMEKAGEITELACQPGFRLEVNGDLICTYKADFSYRDKQGMPVTEDVKGVRTPVYRIKAKLMRALYGITILET
jgi:hypothetical protein